MMPLGTGRTLKFSRAGNRAEGVERDDGYAGDMANVHIVYAAPSTCAPARLNSRAGNQIEGAECDVGEWW